MNDVNKMQIAASQPVKYSYFNLIRCAFSAFIFRYAGFAGTEYEPMTTGCVLPVEG